MCSSDLEHAALASQRVVALGQFADEFVRLRGAGGVFHVLLRRFGAAQADVARNGVGKEESVLKDEDMLTTGIEIEARPAGKKVKRLSLLSGGERSLAAVALLVAIFKARPSPFYVMDWQWTALPG